MAWRGFQVSTISNPTKLLLQLLSVELSWVELRWVLTILLTLSLCGGWGVGGGVGWYEKSFLCLTQLKVMLG